MINLAPILTLHAAVYFEQGDYDKCIEIAEKAIDEGRSVCTFTYRVKLAILLTPIII